MGQWGGTEGGGFPGPHPHPSPNTSLVVIVLVRNFQMINSRRWGRYAHFGSVSLRPPSLTSIMTLVCLFILSCTSFPIFFFAISLFHISPHFPHSFFSPTFFSAVIFYRFSHIGTASGMPPVPEAEADRACAQKYQVFLGAQPHPTIDSHITASPIFGEPPILVTRQLLRGGHRPSRGSSNEAVPDPNGTERNYIPV